MNNPRSADNQRALEAKSNSEKLNEFLSQEKNHILRLASVILKHRVTDSDDEWSIALIAVSDAIASYSEDRGDFWGYAAVVVRNRLYDYLRKQKRIGEHEMKVAPEAFSGDAGDDTETDPARLYVARMSSELVVDSDLKQEIMALKDELDTYGITFKELVEASPKSQKTKKDCALAVAAIFLPPPLYDLLVKKKKLPLKEIESRTKLSRKLLDRHRKHLVAAALVWGDDYPILREYFPYGAKSEVI